MIIKINTITSAHGAAAINYAMDKKTVVKEVVGDQEQKIVIKPIFLNSRNLDVNPLTGEPTSAIDVYQQMRLQEANSNHKLDEPFFRMELRPPIEECRNWTAEQWEQFDRDCENAIQAVDKVPVYNRKTKQREWKAVRPLNLANAQIITTRHIDNDPHIHKIINRHTVDGKALSSHYCNLVGICAANAIAEKYGWTRADKRGNQRKNRINTDADEVLKGMKKFNIEDFFNGMRLKGWTIDPKYDKNGNAVRYRIGETPVGSDRPVMYGASELGQGRRLMVSKLKATWLHFHPEAKQQTKPFKSQEQLEDELYHRLKAEKDRIERENREKDARRAEQLKPREQSPEEKEARSAVDKALKVIGKFTNNTFNVYDQDEQADITEGIVGKCLLGGRDTTRQNLETASNELMNMVEGVATQLEKSAGLMIEIVADVALPQVTPSSSGGGQNTGGWRGKRDDEWWNAWKNVFRAARSRGKGIG